MNLDPEYARAPLRPVDPDSSPSTPDHEQDQDHDYDPDYKRQRSQTLGTTFVSTTVVPDPSSTDVLSSLISSLTLLSDSAREQIRSARELDPNPPCQPSESVQPRSTSSFDAQSHLNISTERDNAIAVDVSDGDEAEPPVVGYTRPRTKDQKRPTSKEKWMSFGSMREKASNLTRSGSSHTILRPHSGASSSIGIPSIERGHSGSSSSVGLTTLAGRRSPLKMSLSVHPDEAFDNSSAPATRDVDVKSVKSFKTGRSKQSTRISQEQEKPNHEPELDAQVELRTPTEQVTKFPPEPKTYSPLNPSNREDLSEHLIPSRRSSMRNSPRRGGGTSKARSPSARRAKNLQSKSVGSAGPEIAKVDANEEFLDEEDSTLRRIRELKQAKERRHAEFRKESRKPERESRRSSRNRSRSGADITSDNKDSLPTTVADSVDHNTMGAMKLVGKIDSGSVTAPVVHEIDLASPVSTVNPAMPSPTYSTPQKHKRSLSVGLRRSNSSKYRPTDDLRSVSEQVEAFLSAPRLTQKIRHPRTGRTIAFSEVGDPNGYAVFCCVGMGLTRFVTTFYDDVARTQKLRLITPDRPGIGESSPFADNVCTPLAWADDVAIICMALNIDKFSLLAHSAGAIYALATALKMPDRVRGRIHLLAPWIPPSQFPNGSSNGEIKAANLPMAHKLLSVLPAPLLKAANSRFLSATSASIEPRSLKIRKKEQTATYDNLLAEMSADLPPEALAGADPASARHSSFSHYAITPTSTPPPYNYASGLATPSPSPTNMKRHFSSRRFRSPTPNEGSISLTPHAKQALFNSELTHRTWSLATLKANPAADLLICLERRRTIGFRYVDVTRSVVIHHGRNDARVPVDNAQWLSGAMKRCELRILDNEGHGLMASANVMSKVLGEIGREWEEWAVIAKDNEKRRRVEELEREKLKEMERKRFIRQGH